MTPRTSLRAQAREIYCELRSQETPHPNPPPQGGREQAAAGGGETNLTTRVRALYEDSAVPVTEIARLVGASGRTIYKYARKHRWKPRYRWNAEGARPRGAKRSAGGDFAPVKGAGSRFIRRADKGKPFANGLKATDPAAAAHAAAQCTQAQLLARAAQAQAEAARRAERHVRAIDAANRALGDLSRFRATRALHYRGRAWPALDLRFERAFLATAEAALRQWEFLLAQG